MWEALCDCGNLHTLYPSQNIKSCGCLRKTKKDFHGQKFYKLTMLEPTHLKQGKATIWKAVCECGTLTKVVPCHAKSGHTKSCGCALRTYHPMISTARNVWDRYKDSGLSFDDFYRLSQQNCAYCGQPPSTVADLRRSSATKSMEQGSFTYNGLDRVDNSKGHTIDNVVPCCHPCNRVKSDHTMQEFLLHIERMYEGTKELRSRILLSPAKEQVLPSRHGVGAPHPA